MNETRVDGNEQQAGGNAGSQDAERLRRLKLGEFLRELVRREGRMEAAAKLGVNYKTLVRAEESGQMTGRMCDALERLLLSGDDPAGPQQPGPASELERRLERLEGGMEALAKELRAGLEALRGAVAGGEGRDRGEGQGPEVGRSQPARSGEEAGRPEAEAVPSVIGLRPAKGETLRRLDPEVVTVEPAGDDEEVYGAAWPLVEEWRSLRAGHPDQGKGLSWLATEERLLTLELAMLEEHGLTLPPETQPLRGFGRKGQTNWRRTALEDTRKARARRELLRWVRRCCTLGLWWQ